MKKEEIVLKIPYGTRDFLPNEAMAKRQIEDAVASVFVKWGYEEIVSPTFEFLETLTIGNNDEMQQNMFKFFDKDNTTLGLRYDMTTPIARVASTRLNEENRPLKLSYIANVFRYEQAQMGRQCEFYQAGVELMGVCQASADAEVIALSIETLRRAGLENFQISLGQIQFINGVMEESGLSKEKQEKLKEAMVNRDLVSFNEEIENSGLTDKHQEALKQLPLLHGHEEILAKAKAMTENEKSKNALVNLEEIFALLKVYGVEQYISFDLGIIRDFDYYTGMVFEAYTQGLGFPLCGGGRYDKMLKTFGNDCPATGFALGIERIMLALERQKINYKVIDKNIYVAWSEGKLGEAILKAKALRTEGLTVEVGFASQTEVEAKCYQELKKYQTLVYVS